MHVKSVQYENQVANTSLVYGEGNVGSVGWRFPGEDKLNKLLFNFGFPETAQPFLGELLVTVMSPGKQRT